MLFLMIALISIGLVLNSLMYSAKALSNERISVYINLASGKQMTDIDIDKMSLSKKDLQFLGVYISNFFIPFGTELGDSGNEEKDSTNKEDIKKALQTNLNFSDAMADTLTDTLLGLSRGSIKELTLCVSKDYQGTLEEVKEIPLNYYTALSCMLGGLNKIVDKYDDKSSVLEGISAGDYKYGYFAYSEGGKLTPVFDFNINMDTLTPSAAAFIKCLESADIELGYGFNFFDFTTSEMKTAEDYKDKLENLSENDIYKMSAYGIKLAVDCFGDIILMGGNHQFIAVPGCMNPYTWVEVDSTGREVGDGLGGTAYNIANIPSMSLYDSKGSDENINTLFNSISSGEKTGVLETKILANKLKKVAWDNKKGEYSLRKVRGSNSSSLSDNIITELVGKSTYRDLAEKAEEGFKSSNPNARNYYNIKNNIVSSTKTIDIYGKPVTDSQVLNDRSIKVFDSFVYTDNLGAAHFDESGESADPFTTFNVASYLDDNNDSAKKVRSSMSSWSNSKDNGFANTYKNIKDGVMAIPSNVSKEAMIGLYVTYAYSSLYDEDSESAKKQTIGKLQYKMNKKGLPNIPDEPLTLSNNAKTDIMLSSIRDWVYYILHPTDGFEYFKIWITNKLNSFLVGWHEDMVGSNGTGSINGTTAYRGNSGYVTSPELSDIPWADSLVKFYNNAIPFLLVAMLIIMIGSYIVGILSIQKSIIGFIIFAICAQLPIPLINGLVGTSNRFSSKLYGEKFTYWALVQNESYSKAIDNAVKDGNYSNYLKTLHEENSKINKNQGTESIMLKWQAPKKMSSLMLTSNDKEALGGFGTSKLLSGLINSTYSGESYLDDTDSTYLYRSYIDIANFSRYIHRGLSSSNTKQQVNLNLSSDITENWNPSLKEAILNYASVYEADRSLGYANKNGDGSTSGTGNNIIRVRLPLSSGIVSEALGQKGTISNMSLNDYVGINQDAFKFSIPMFNVSSLDYHKELKTDNFNAEKYPRSDFSGLAAYGLMSENPFYYFSWYLYESGLSADSGTNIGYKNLLLGDDNAGFFYNTRGNGELKDFMDMRSLFTYIIPYLKQGNDIVKEWDDTYGIFIYDGVPTEEGHQNDTDIKNNPELKQKYWHNLNVARLYNIYTPWVDVMYDCSYSKQEKISYLGESYTVLDPLNPSSYPSERPMIFSKSEMVDYGLEEHQLTKVEKLILKAEKGMQERLFKLLNYYSFSDTVLNTAAAMNCAFEFNSVFSENSLFGSNHNIYPQSFELSDFSYDAFLRFILANSTGESMIINGDGSFYSNVVNKSSTTTIIVMLLLDIVAVYVIPGLKIFFIMGIFIMAIFTILMSAFKVDPKFKFTKRLMGSLVKPMISFLIINCTMAWVISLFMGEGNTKVTGSLEQSISLGDPVMVMLAMLVLNGVVLYLLWKMLYNVWKDIKTSSKVLGNFVLGVSGSLGGLAFASAVGKSSRNFASEGNEGGMNSRARMRGQSSIEDREIGIQENQKSRGVSINIINKKSNKGYKKGKNNSEGKYKKSIRDIEGKVGKGLNAIKKSLGGKKKNSK